MNNCRQQLFFRLPRPAVFYVVLLGLCAGPVASAQPGTPDSGGNAKEGGPSRSGSDLAAIRAGSVTFVAAFNKRDAKAVAALWTQDGEYIDEAGRRIAGRDAIEKAYAEFFADHPNVALRITIESLRQVSPKTAIEQGRATVEPGRYPRQLYGHRDGEESSCSRIIGQAIAACRFYRWGQYQGHC